MKLWIYLIRRLLLLVPVLIGVITITFLLLISLPLDVRLHAVYSCSAHGCPNECVPCPSGTTGGCEGQAANCPNPLWAALIHRLGLDQPIPIQWANYVYNLFSGQWGYNSPNSLASGGADLAGEQFPVVTILAWYLPYTLELAFLSLVLILVLSLPLGTYSAVYRNRPLDQGARVISFSGFAMPTYMLAILVLFAFATLAFPGGCNPPYNNWIGSWPPFTCNSFVIPSWMGIHQETYPTHFPTFDAFYGGAPLLGIDSLRRMLIPALVIAYASVAGILRFVRNSMLEVMNLDFVRTARSKGVPERAVVRHHAGRNSLNVTVTVLGLTFAYFIGGFPVIETVFNLKGVGLIFALSVNTQAPDIGLLFGSVYLLTLVVVVANLLVDLTYAWLDPRVRLG